MGAKTKEGDGKTSWARPLKLIAPRSVKKNNCNSAGPYGTLRCSRTVKGKFAWRKLRGYVGKSRRFISRGTQFDGP